LVFFYIGFEKPYADSDVMFIEVFNEVVITLIIIVLPCFLYFQQYSNEVSIIVITLICILMLANTAWVIYKIRKQAKEEWESFLEDEEESNQVKPVILPQESPMLTMEVEPDMNKGEASGIVSHFLMLNLFRNRIETFSFFIKFWMPYERKVEAGLSMWQKRVTEEGGSKEDLKVRPNLMWRRDFEYEKSSKTVSSEMAEWIHDWEVESLE
jgi:hypothetical protein